VCINQLNTKINKLFSGFLKSELLYNKPVKSTIMKNLLLLAVLTLTFMSCDKDDINDVPPVTIEAKVLGEWQLYRDENLESIIDEWTGSEWTYIDQWFQNTRENSEIILEFNDDGTFIDRYADVPVASGIWGELEDGRYYFDYDQEGNTNDQLTQRRYITFYCDNTYSIEIEGNARAVYYYRIIGTTECSEDIIYNVTD